MKRDNRAYLTVSLPRRRSFSSRRRHHFTDLSKDTTRLSENHFQRLLHALSTSRRSKTVMTTSQQVSRQVFDGAMMIFRQKWTRHDRRHKSVGDASSRVCEATRRVFVGLTRASRRHRSRYENGDEPPCRNVPPSVIMSELNMVTSARNETESTTRHYKRCQGNLYRGISSSRRDPSLSQTNNLPPLSLRFWSYEAERI